MRAPVIDVRRLELPMPDLGREIGSLEDSAKDMEARIRSKAPQELRKTIRVRVLKKGGMPSIVIEYDDKAENYVYAALEYPKGGKKEKHV